MTFDKHQTKKLLSFLLSLSLLFSTSFITSFASSDEISRISCCIYGDGATGRGFCWYTAQKTGSDLQIVKSADFDEQFSRAVSYSGTATKYRERYSHKVAVTDLLPGEKYFYRVGDKEKNLWSDVGTFVTDDKDNSFSFITIADVQAQTREEFQLSYKTAQTALSILPDAEFFVCLGDYVNNNTNEEWDWFFECFKGINTSLTHVPVSGNHDGSITNKLNSFCFQNTFCVDESRNKTIDGVHYSFDYGNAHFAVLNTNDMFPMSQAQRNWLINDMSNTDAEWKIILAHRSFYSAGKNINKPDAIAMRNDIIPIIDELGIDMLYAGHDHMYFRTPPVMNDEKTETKYVTEIYNGKETRFALNPKGTVYTLPSTAGPKRYVVNENILYDIEKLAEVEFSTRDMGGCFCTTEIDGNKLIYKAYAVDDETDKVSLIDEFAIEKTEKKECIEPTSLDESLMTTFKSFPSNFITAVIKMLFSYILLLINMI